MSFQQAMLSDTWPLLFCALINGLALVLMCSRRARSPWGRAEQKALFLLKHWLSSAQVTQYENNGYFEVRGSHSGKRYRIRCARQMNVDEIDEHGARLGSWCFGPEGDLQLGDVMLAQKIALENDERAALAIARRGH
jgi:hypothetical protein